MGVNGKQDETRYIIFQQKTRKNGKTDGKTLEKNTGKKNNKYKKDRHKILTKFWEMLKTETSFQQDFGKC
jgi:hypothetical protein